MLGEAFAAAVDVIPRPSLCELRDGRLSVAGGMAIRAEASLRETGRLLADALEKVTQRPWSVATLSDETRPNGDIVLRKTAASAELGDEGYRLDVTADGVTIEASTPAGAFYGCQTLRQLFAPVADPPKAHSKTAWTIPCIHIVDRPRFAWRGMMLDSARHFQDKATVERYIDLLACYKMNRLHWHLTDDQGWRVEIKKYPRLTEVGAWRPNRNAELNRLPGGADERYGGFYTQDDLREIVAYAAARNVTIVPEIEMPGHCLAMLAAYPELSCTGGSFTLGKTWIYQDVCCAGNDRVFEFLDDVLTEVAGLFPSPWIHVGGDECPKNRWRQCPKCHARIQREGLRDESELQSYFIRRMAKIVEAKGRRLIGWDEILEGGLAPSATVQSWRGTSGGLAAARAGHDVIMSPGSHCYLDHSYQALTTKKSYSYEPIPPQLEPDRASHVLGIEGCMWLGNVSKRYLLRTGQVLPTAGIDVQVFPRLLALAEVGWSPKDNRDWADFKGRVREQARQLELRGVSVARDVTVWDDPTEPK